MTPFINPIDPGLHSRIAAVLFGLISFNSILLFPAGLENSSYSTQPVSTSLARNNNRHPSEHPIPFNNPGEFERLDFQCNGGSRSIFRDMKLEPKEAALQLLQVLTKFRKELQSSQSLAR